MELKIVNDFPPNYADIIKVFRLVVDKKSVVFAYGDTIFNPFYVQVPPEIVIHEQVHCLRQAEYEGGPAAWWDRYLHDRQFRLLEELLAHRAEYKALMEAVPNRKMRKGCLAYMAKKLAAPLYDHNISVNLAKKWLGEDCGTKAETGDNVEPA